MIGPPGVSRLPLVKGFPVVTVVLLTLGVCTCSMWANLSFAVTNPVHYRYFPPFRSHVNANNNRHLGGESFNMARSMVAGEGFSHPFDQPTGPTAWQPPLLPILLA